MINWKSKSSWISIIVTAALAWALSRVFDMTAAGAVKLWSTLLEIATWGSTTMRDAPYASAALNPYQNASLMLLDFMLAAVLMSSLFLSVSLIRLFLKARRLFEPQRESNHEVNKDRLKQRLTRLFISAISLKISLLVTILIFVIFVSSTNEAVYARRIFEADRDILAPYFSTTELSQLQADFAGVETKAQYKVIMSRLEALADIHHVKIHKMDW